MHQQAYRLPGATLHADGTSRQRESMNGLAISRSYLVALAGYVPEMMGLPDSCKTLEKNVSHTNGSLVVV
ncbi:hypothetical protein CEXT_452161 [Caerostris extrusa]|uniref:Uncharacterized protein n=1 Tax=Caerostris extrusa TaxID=172846 RepID=A0AAV4T2G4_CAEEX|nr:hypothetical protein CEXT_452161 [Caerostris extrusa]